MRKLIVLFALLSILAPTALIPACASTHGKKPPPTQQGQNITVWVNLKTGIYHYPGTRWYGKTKDGEYMKESEARKDGYRPAENGQ